MSAEIKSISGAVISRERPLRDEGIAQHLAELTALNDAGKLRALAFVRVYVDGGFGSNWVYNPGPYISGAAMIGALATLQSDMINSLRVVQRDRNGDLSDDPEPAA